MIENGDVDLNKIIRESGGWLDENEENDIDLPKCLGCREYLIEGRLGLWYCLCGRVYSRCCAPNEIWTLLSWDVERGREKYLELLKNGQKTRPLRDIVKELDLS